MCFFTMLLKRSSSSMTTHTIRVSSTQRRTYIRTIGNLFPLPANNSTVVHLLLLWKESKHFPQQNAHAKGFFVNYVIWSAISGTICRTLWLSICWWSKQESYGSTLRRLKSAPRFSGKGNQTQDQTK
jgi:hypothetical protein